MITSRKQKIFNFVEEIYALSPKFLQKPPPSFSTVHLLHRLYGVDAPVIIKGGNPFTETENGPEYRYYRNVVIAGSSGLQYE